MRVARYCVCLYALVLGAGLFSGERGETSAHIPSRKSVVVVRQSSVEKALGRSVPRRPVLERESAHNRALAPLSSR